MEFGSIEREIHIDASPEVVFEVISTPEHMREWWNGVETGVAAVVGTESEFVWAEGDEPRAHVEAFKVVEVDPPRRFAFRWVYPDRVISDEARSLLVTFELEPSGAGTRLRVSETGFREMGWEVAVLERAYQQHVEGWDLYVPQIGTYSEKVAVAS